MESITFNKNEFFQGMEESQEINLSENLKVWTEETLNTEENGIEVKVEDYSSIHKDKILRIETNLYDSWGGVTSCGRISRVRGIVDREAKRWVERKMFEYKNLRWISYGWKYNTARITSGRTPFPNNERWCRGTITTPVFIEFVNK